MLHGSALYSKQYVVRGSHKFLVEPQGITTPHNDTPGSRGSSEINHSDNGSLGCGMEIIHPTKLNLLVKGSAGKTPGFKTGLQTKTLALE